MMSTKAITIRTETATIADIDSLAKAMDRSRNYVVNQAMISYVARSISGQAPSPIAQPDATTVEAVQTPLVRKAKLGAKPEAKSPAKKKNKKTGKKKKKKPGKKSKK